MKFRHVCDVCGEEYIFTSASPYTAKVYLQCQRICIQGRHNLPDNENMYDHAEYFGPYHG